MVANWQAAPAAEALTLTRMDALMDALLYNQHQFCFEPRHAGSQAPQSRNFHCKELLFFCALATSDLSYTVQPRMLIQSRGYSIWAGSVVI